MTGSTPSPGPSNASGTPKASQAVADEIRAMIAVGQLRPGDALPSETTLMETFGVARPTMREVIRILESDGLVEVRRGPRGGPVIKPLTAQSLARRAEFYLAAHETSVLDLISAQAAIEPGVARVAATHRTDEDLTALRRQVHRIEQCQTLAAFAPLAAQFHVAIMEASGNTTLRMVGQMLSDLLVAAYTRTLSAADTDTDGRVTRAIIASSVVWYTQLVDALEAGDPDAAEQIWRRHQHMARRLAKDVLAGKAAASVQLFPPDEPRAMFTVVRDEARGPVGAQPQV